MIAPGVKLFMPPPGDPLTMEPQLVRAGGGRAVGFLRAAAAGSDVVSNCYHI